MTKEEFIKHLLKAKVVLEKLAKKQDVYDEIEERMYEEYRKEENPRITGYEFHVINLVTYSFKIGNVFFIDVNSRDNFLNSSISCMSLFI